MIPHAETRSWEIHAARCCMRIFISLYFKSKKAWKRKYFLFASATFAALLRQKAWCFIWLKKPGLEKEFVIDSAGILAYHQGNCPIAVCVPMPPQRIWTGTSFASCPYGRFLQLRSYNRYGWSEHGRSEGESTLSGRVEKDPPDDGILHPYPCRSRARPLLWRCGGLWIRARHTWGCLCRTPYFFNSG